jgi:hypothetical protein
LAVAEVEAVAVGVADARALSLGETVGRRGVVEAKEEGVEEGEAGGLGEPWAVGVRVAEAGGLGESGVVGEEEGDAR